MDLTLEQLRSIALGVVWVRQQEGGIVFSRFTDEQLALYDNTTLTYQANFHNTARYNGGIRLSFRTNSRSLYIAGFFYKEREVRRHFSVDVFANGECSVRRERSPFSYAYMSFSVGGNWQANSVRPNL